MKPIAANVLLDISTQQPSSADHAMEHRMVIMELVALRSITVRVELQGRASHHAHNAKKDMEMKEHAKNVQEMNTVMEQKHVKSNMQIAWRPIM